MTKVLKQPFGEDYGNETNVGSAGTGVTANEYGDGVRHTTVLNISDLTLITPTAAANKADGKKIYSLPAGNHIVRGTKLNVNLLASDDPQVCDADTPDLGVGTTIATGAVAVLGGTAGFENLLTGQTMADCDATSKEKTVNTELVVESGDSHDIYLNVADGWAGADTIVANGTVTIIWETLP